MWHGFQFFCMSCKFFGNWAFWVLCCRNLGNLVLPLLRGCRMLLLRAEVHLWLFQTNFTKYVFLLCGHWSFCSFIFAVSQWPDKNFLKCLVPKRYVWAGSTIALNPLDTTSALGPPTMATNFYAGPLVIKSSNWQSEPTIPIGGGQGPHCPSKFQQIAPATWATVHTAVYRGLGTGEW